MSIVFLRYTNKETGAVFYNKHEAIEHPDSFRRKVKTLFKEIGNDSKCDVQEISERRYLDGQERRRP